MMMMPWLYAYAVQVLVTSLKEQVQGNAEPWHSPITSGLMSGGEKFSRVFGAERKT